MGFRMTSARRRTRTLGVALMALVFTIGPVSTGAAEHTAGPRTSPLTFSVDENASETGVTPDMLTLPGSASTETYITRASDRLDQRILKEASATLSPDFINYDAVSMEECTAGDPATVWQHKNHYSSCVAIPMEFRKTERCWFFRTCVSSNWLGLAVVGNGGINTIPGAPVRRVKYAIKTQAGPRTGPSPLPDGTAITVSIKCQARGTSLCETNADGSSFIKNEWVKTLSLGEWRAGQQLTADFNMTGAADDSSDPNGASFYNMVLSVSQSGPAEPGTQSLAADTVRCDTEQYNRQPIAVPSPTDNGACIFSDVRAIIQFDRSPTSPFAEAAQHIYDAQTTPMLTKPGIANVSIPGSLESGQPLQRLVPQLSIDNGARYTGNRRLARETCVTFWGRGYARPENSPPKDCDEYPPASTYEGAAYSANNGGGNLLGFSARPIDRVQNQAAGRALGSWYSTDHILEQDLFYVDVVP